MSIPTINLDREHPVVLERIRLGKAGGPPIGVMVKVGKADLAVAGAIVDDLLAYAQVRLAKARLPQALKRRDEVFAAVVPSFRAELVAYFAGFLRRAGIAKIDPEDIEWAEEESQLAGVLRKVYVELGGAAFETLAGQLGVDLEFDLEAPATKGIRAAIATRVTGIAETTRELVRTYVDLMIERGYSIEQLVAGVAEDGFLGLDALFGERARTIALTESATAYNLASSAGYRESGLVEEVVIFDGADCGWDGHDDPDLADGSIRTLDEFEETPTSHPNCQRAAGPVVSE